MASVSGATHITTLQRQLAQVPVTSVAFYTSSRDRYFLAGQDGHLVIYKDHASLVSLPIFQDQPIHGICVQESRILLWGAAKIALLNGEPLSEGNAPLLLATVSAPDWIYHGAISPFDPDVAVLATAHNEAVRMRFCPDAGAMIMGDVISPSRPMLYAAHLSWVSEMQVLVAAGTVFGDVLVWTYDLSNDDQIMLHVLQGHEGSIYGVEISPKLTLCDGSTTRLLASCSDDRTIRVWDIRGDAAVPKTSLPGRFETGFKAAESYTEVQTCSDEGSNPVAVAMGHASRIWGVKFGIGPDESTLEQNNLCIYSFGEDATTQRWKLDLRSTTDHLTGTLTHQHTYSLHNGKHVWARALDVHSRGVSILTGGADSKISVIEESAQSEAGTSLATIDVPNLLASLLGEQDAKSREMISRYDFTTADHILAVTNLGRLFSGDLATQSWEQVSMPEDVADDLKKCYVLRKLGPGAAIIGTTNGKIYHFNGQLVLSADIPGRIAEINHLSTTLDSAQVLIHLHGSSSSHLLILSSSGELLQRQLLANLDARFVAVSATRMDDLLILGSRHGWISLLTLQKDTWSPILDVATRSRDAITGIVPLPGYSSTPYFLATSRDGKYRIYSINRTTSQPRLNLLHETAPPFGPMIEGAWFTEDRDPDLLLYGFRSKDFVIWNESTREELATVDCGGAHRTFRLDYNTLIPEKYRFAYTRTSMLSIYSQKRVPYRTIRSGTHGREIRALSSNGRFVASGAEDTSIRIWEYTGESANMRYLACMKAHVTGLQKLHWFEDEYLFSSAGNEEFFVWRVRRLHSAYNGLAVVCEGVFADKSPIGDLRIMDFDISRGGGKIVISMAFSNSTMKTYEYHEGRFRLLSIGEYTGACITQLRHLGLRGTEINIMTASTDGHLVLWRTSVGEAAGQVYLLKAAAAVHQSSIKSLDILRDGTKYCIVTGGDDNAIAFVVVDLGHGDSTTASYRFVTKGVVRKAHAAAVNGVALLGQTSDCQSELLAATVSNDQRVKIWRISIDHPQRVTLAACMSSGVADPGDVAVVCADQGQPLHIVLGGVGLEACRVTQSRNSLEHSKTKAQPQMTVGTR